MNYIIDFYKGLDTLNLIIFWGIIIVIILLLILSIAIANKNKKLKKIIANKSQTFDDQDELPIIKEPIVNPTVNNDSFLFKESEEIQITNPENLSEEEKFIAEEHVIEYSNDFPSFDNNQKNEKQKYEIPIKEPVNELPNAPYQKNVLREMSLGQTSPIGIVKPVQKELENAKELYDSFIDNETTHDNGLEIKKSFSEKTSNNISNYTTFEQNKSNNHTNSIYIEKVENQSEHQINKNNKYYQNDTNSISDYNQQEVHSSLYQVKNIPQSTINREEHIIVDSKQISTEKNNSQETIDEEKSSLLSKLSTSSATSQEKYLQEVSDKLYEAKELEGISRTEYELKQEEDAIISYEELMRKKDSIQIVDEEDAVISIEELINRKNQTTKLYNLTEEEEHEKFINELKNFRNDL